MLLNHTYSKQTNVGEQGHRHVLNATSSYLCGHLVTPCIPSVVGGVSASNTRKSNRCSSDVMNKNISILASECPRHMRHPGKYPVHYICVPMSTLQSYIENHSRGWGWVMCALTRLG